MATHKYKWCEYTNKLKYTRDRGRILIRISVPFVFVCCYILLALILNIDMQVI